MRNIKLQAFTIFEVTVVLALLSTIVTLLMIAVNRFNEQLKNSSELHKELNDWFAFRSNLWNEFFYADSLSVQKNTVSIYAPERTVMYRKSGEWLERNTGTEWQPTGIKIEGIEEEQAEEGSSINFFFEWKGEPIHMAFRRQQDVKAVVNSYFEKNYGTKGGN